MSELLAYLSALEPHDRLVLAVVFGLLALFLTASAYILWLQRRNEQQLRAELEMRSGWRGLQRRGWLPEDLQ